DPAIKKVRSEQLIALAQQLGDDYKKSFIGDIIELLIEERKGTECIGHSKNYLKLSVIDPVNVAKQGEVYTVIVKEVENEKIISQFA
ncbi:MAG TPA: hypothetical protein VLS94_03265, partial [Fusibacter sp.]|nr:hypothetical protein [Fusibacter sp.]